MAHNPVAFMGQLFRIHFFTAAGSYPAMPRLCHRYPFNGSQKDCCSYLIFKTHTPRRVGAGFEPAKPNLKIGA